MQKAWSNCRTHFSTVHNQPEAIDVLSIVDLGFGSLDEPFHLVSCVVCLLISINVPIVAWKFSIEAKLLSKRMLKHVFSQFQPMKIRYPDSQESRPRTPRPRNCMARKNSICIFSSISVNLSSPATQENFVHFTRIRVSRIQTTRFDKRP